MSSKHPGGEMKRSTGGALAVLLLAVACSPAEENRPEAPVAGAPTLRGTVGTEESPNAFEIALVDEDGKAVTDLPAGEYNIEVTDRTDVHNFHLSGGGGAVDEKTGPTEKIEALWVVTFKPGEYRYLCDPHPSMNGHFTVS
jgi:plastocyanin